MEMLHKLLMDRYDEIRAEESSEEKDAKIIGAYDLVRDFAKVGHAEGLLALEERTETLDMSDETQAFFYEQMMMIIDGTDPKLVAEIGMNKLITKGLRSYEGLRSLIFYRGSLLIQSGENLSVIDHCIKSMMPVSCVDVLKKRESATDFSRKSEEAEDLIRRLCEDDRELDEQDYSLINQTALTFVKLSDKSMQRLLKETDAESITLAMKLLPGKARKRVFDSLSVRLRDIIAEDMEFMGPVRRKDIDESCRNIMKTLIRLTDCGEIADIDASLLKVVLDICDYAKRQNRELQEKYTDLKKVIEDIYRAN